jgi:hypothetical protein
MCCLSNILIGPESPLSLVKRANRTSAFGQLQMRGLLSPIKLLPRRRSKLFSLFGPVILGLISGTCCAPSGSGYSVLTHEAIIDAAWKDSIVPVLLKRFPNATPEQLLHAHAYAYGGAIIQDMGYYPFGNAFFSDLTHYVRNGEFVLGLIEESRDLNEYAFALNFTLIVGLL